LNHVTVPAFMKALDAVEAMGEKANVLVVTNEGKFFCNGADMSAKIGKEQMKAWQKQLGQLFPRVLTYPLPTVAAVRGHCTGPSGLMFGLAFDYRAMSTDRGVMFMGGADMGVVFPPFTTEILKAKMDKYLQREIILFNAKRFGAEELAQHGVVDIAAPADEILPKALELAATLKPKGQGPARKALKGIKENVYKGVLEAMKAPMGKGGKGKRPSGQVYVPPAKDKEQTAAKL